MRLLLLLSLSMPAFASPLDDSISKVDIMLTLGSYRDARVRLLKLVKIEPNNNKILELLGRVYFQMNKFKISRKYFNRMDARKLSSKGGYAWGAVYYESRQWKRAIFGLKKVTAKNEYSQLASYIMGICYYHMDRLYHAEKYLKKASSIDLLPSMKRNKIKVLSIIEKRRDFDVKEFSGKGEAIADKGVGNALIPINQYTFKKDSKKTKLDNSQSFLIKAGLELNQKSRTFSNHGYVDEGIEILSHKESVALVKESHFGDERQDFLGLRAEVALGEVAAKYQEAKLITLDDITGDFISKEETSIIQKYGIASIQPFLNYSLGLSSSIHLSFVGESFFPQGNEPEYGLNYGNIQYQYLGKFAQLKARFTQGNRQSKSAADSFETAEQQAQLSLKFYNSFLILGFTYESLARTGDIYISEFPYRNILSGLQLQAMDGLTETQLGSAYLTVSLGDLKIRVSGENITKKSPFEDIGRQRSTAELDEVAPSVQTNDVLAFYPLLGGVTLYGRVVSKVISKYAYYGVDASDSSEFLYLSKVSQSGGVLGGRAKFFDILYLSVSLGLLEHVYTPLNYEMDESFVRANPKTLTFSKLTFSVATEF